MKALKSLLLALFLSFSTLGIVACVDGGNESESYEVTFVAEEDIPMVRLGVEYDFEPYFTKAADTTYTITARYLRKD